jgi:glycolate oxidase
MANPASSADPVEPRSAAGPAERAAALAEFRRLLPPSAVVESTAERRVYECDGLVTRREVPWLVLLPESVEQVQGVVRVCRRFGIPLVPRGAGTGLSGGALPHPGGVLLGLARLDRVLQIDPVNLLARVQPGVTNARISEAARPCGLYYAPDPSSQIACTIGGNVAENAGGVHCLKYGLTVHNLQSLLVVDSDGELLRLGGDGFDAPGYDLLALLTGSEGMLAVVVEASVRLQVLPAEVEVILAGFRSVREAGDAVGAIIAAGIVPAGLEMMDRLAIAAAEDFAGAGYPRDAEALLLCEVDGVSGEAAAQAARVEGLLARCGAFTVRRAQSEVERARFWRGRKAAFPAVGRLSPDYLCMDGTIPRGRISEVLTAIAELAASHGLRVANVFHAGDGNLHPLILFDASDDAQVASAEALGGRILELCLAAGGTITGEHGVGVEKLDQMCAQFTADELGVFRAVKAAFDPAGFLNPGKAVPSLRRCAEYGALRVRGGALPFPELERF